LIKYSHLNTAYNYISLLQQSFNREQSNGQAVEVVWPGGVGP